MTRDLASYRQLPYERVWEARAEGSDVYFLVRLRDLPMVAADGHNKAEALSNLRSAFDDFIEWAIADGVDVPCPSRPFLDSPGVASKLEWQSVPSRVGIGVDLADQPPTGLEFAHEDLRADVKELQLA